jgi:hypothetical protein
MATGASYGANPTQLTFNKFVPPTSENALQLPVPQFGLSWVREKTSSRSILWTPPSVSKMASKFPEGSANNLV